MNSLAKPTPFPSAPATLANWRTAPFNAWAFHHVREIVPSADIPNDALAVWPLEFHENLRVKAEADRFFDETGTDGLAIVHRGKLVYERYANGMTPDTPHILMSVSKAMLGLLAGILAARGALDLEARVAAILPELAGSGFDGASVRDLLDMRSGVAFDEDYLVTSGPMVEYRKSTGWNPLEPGEAPSDLRSFLRDGLKAKARAHGGAFQYISPNTDLLGWVIERACQRRYADLMSEHLWRPLGAERSAYITVDRLGAPRCAGGMCVTLRDLARVGRLMLDGGQRAGREVVPARWIDDLERGGDTAAWDQGNLVQYFPGMSIGYRAKWYSLRGQAPLVFGWGIHGQHLFVDRRNGTAIAKLSSQAAPIDAAKIPPTIAFAQRTGAALASSS